MFQKASCPCHLELCFYTLPELWWQNWMAPNSQHLLNVRVLWRTQSPASCSPQASPRRKLCESGLPGGLERDWNHDSQQRALQTLTPAASVSRFTSWLGLFCIPQAHTGRGLSSQRLQNPITQDLQPTSSMLCSPLALSEIRNISGNF